MSARNWAPVSAAREAELALPAPRACSVCGQVRLPESLHRKAILGQPQWVCAPSCLEAGRRAMSR